MLQQGFHSLPHPGASLVTQSNSLNVPSPELTLKFNGRHNRTRNGSFKRLLSQAQSYSLPAPLDLSAPY